MQKLGYLTILICFYFMRNKNLEIIAIYKGDEIVLFCWENLVFDDLFYN